MDVEQAIRTRRTHKAFGPKPIERNILDELFELARRCDPITGVSRGWWYWPGLPVPIQLRVRGRSCRRGRLAARYTWANVNRRVFKRTPRHIHRYGLLQLRSSFR
jgi:hypothetical protein